MAEFDANYIRLLKLVPQLNAYRNKSFFEYALLDDSSDFDFESEASSNIDDPEKYLVGLSVEFFIADLDRIEDKVTVEIKILEAFKYTTTLEIVQKPEFRRWMTNPSMLVRVYHDASTAEVVSYQGHRNLQPRYTQPNPKMYHADEKMQVNRFLGEWLTHCLNVGRSTRAAQSLLST